MEIIMKNTKFLIALILFGLLLNPLGIFAQGGIKKSTSKPFQLDKAKFTTEIYKKFDSKAMGYQVILLKKGQIVEEVADGWARNVEDGNVKMTVNTPANIGSTVKFFAGTALLQKLQKGTYLGGGFNTRLLEPAYRYLPKIWQDNMDVSIQKITLKDLLQHKGGFIHNDPDPSLKVFFDYLKKGVSMDQTQAFAYGKRKYANANITLIGYLLAAVDNPAFLTNLNNTIAAKKLKADDPLIQTYLGQAFENYMKANIFSKIKPAIAPSCDAPNEYPQNVKYAKSYALPSTVTKGAEYSSKTDNVSKACHAAGGWYITGRELAAYVANFAATETIVSDETRNLMFEDDAPQNQLLWSMNIPDPDLLKNFGWNTSPYMGGDHGGAHATIVKLPNDYYAVGIVNSGILDDKGQVGSSYLLTQKIIEAFNSSVAASF